MGELYDKETDSWNNWDWCHGKKHDKPYFKKRV